MLGDICCGPMRGVPKLQSPMAAAKSASSSSCSLASAVEGRVSILEWRKCENAGDAHGALLVKELEGPDW